MDCNGKDDTSVFCRGKSWMLDFLLLTPVLISHLSPFRVLQWESSAKGREGSMSSHTMYEETPCQWEQSEGWNGWITMAVWSGSLNEMGPNPKLCLSVQTNTRTCIQKQNTNNSPVTAGNTTSRGDWWETWMCLTVQEGCGWGEDESKKGHRTKWLSTGKCGLKWQTEEDTPSV